jgi:hypothetical protein
MDHGRPSIRNKTKKKENEATAKKSQLLFYRKRREKD